MEATRTARTGNVEWTCKLCGAFGRILQAYNAARDKVQDIENIEEWEHSFAVVTAQFSDVSLVLLHWLIFHLAKAC